MDQKNSLSDEIKGTAPQETKTVVRTMKDDVETAIKKQEETLVSIALAEQKKKQAAREAAERAALIKAGEEKVAGNPRGRIFLILVVIALGILGVGGYRLLPYISIPAFLKPSNAPTPTVEQLPATTTTPIVVTLTPALIPTQAETTFSLKTQTAPQIFSSIASERTNGDTSWQVKNIIINDVTKGTDGVEKVIPLSTNRLLSLAESDAPEILARSLQNIFMMGFFNDSSSTIPTPFIILKVSGYSTSLAGMLTWEASLPGLFDTVFGTKIKSGLSANTKTRDIVILGHDSRVLEITPNVGIAYTFANPSTIIITASRTALEKIIPLIK